MDGYALSELPGVCLILIGAGVLLLLSVRGEL